MARYLLTWYGMTDLRAALGLETTDGPVLSALRTGDYTDIVILAYTDPTKTPPTANSERTLDSVSNTPAAHDLFISWLRASLSESGIAVRVQLVPQVLVHLNDAAGIHKAATAAVRLALADHGEKEITTYVSPGTPVMAYTWALIARSNPQLRLRVISSSDPRSAPEAIELPTTLLNPSIDGSSGGETLAREYDLVIHLLGQQVMPIFFALRQFQAERHVAVTSREYLEEVDRLAKVTPVDPTPIVITDPFRPADTKKAVASLVESLPDGARVAVNMTGGTKLMFAGALNACWELGLDPFYFEIKHHNAIFLRDGSKIPFVGISDVEDFLKAGDHRTVTPGLWPSEPAAIKNIRQPATAEMWSRRDALRTLYQDREFQAFSSRYDRHMPPYERDMLSFAFSWKSGEASLDGAGAAKLVLKGTEVTVPRKGYFRFLSGGWLEEYVYSLLRPLQDEGVIRDVRVGMEAGFRQVVAAKHEMPAQEFDCAFTDGKRLWIVECKAGLVKQEAIQKLENNLRQYGGVAARGLLVSGLPLIEANQSRVDSISAITAVHPDHLTTDMLRLIIQAG